MTELTRTLRFCPVGDPAAPRRNGFAAWPPLPEGSLAGVLELRVTLAGEVDPATGLLVNVKEVDDAFADLVLPRLNPAAGPVALLRLAAEAFGSRFPLARLSFHPGPRSSLTLAPSDMARVTLRQRYTFSAAHRLVAAGLSEEENEALFGKCHRPSFHGHNYLLEVAASAEVDAHGRSLGPDALDAAVVGRVIDAYDHRNLNTDVADFAGRNPTVEHIAASCYHRPGGPPPRRRRAGGGDRLGDRPHFVPLRGSAYGGFVTFTSLRSFLLLVRGCARAKPPLRVSVPPLALDRRNEHGAEQPRRCACHGSRRRGSRSAC